VEKGEERGAERETAGTKEPEVGTNVDWLRLSREEPEREIVEAEDEPEVVTEVSPAISKSIRSMVSCEFPLGMNRVSFSFLIIIS
jgi:Ribonuclease G/E